ncbi:MAG: isoaspartyl peptidase/L-asparaginase [Saprospiraceae bacterium]|nr:isoaspartyl peptidase/L-asparaginase [Saprospiraceae bacterium]
MKKYLFPILLLSLLWTACSQPAEHTENGTSKSVQKAEYAIVIHGGAGTIKRENMSSEKEEAYRTALNKALDIGEGILKNGGTALEAVEKTIMSMEDSPLFNAGKGAVFTHEGRNELDASIMHGADRNAGAVGGITIVRNPIQAAIAVMEQSPHVMLTGKGAEEFALEQELDTVSNDYFYTERRWESLQKILERENQETGYMEEYPDYKFGTVGCVALDKNGNIVAGTSTGGMTNKRYNRIGDSPIIGAGTYADNATCGVSCTGHGEFFIRWAVAYDVSAIMAYKEVGVKKAADMVVNEKLVDVGGSGGLIALDKYGNVAMPFNTEGMYRGYAKPNERVVQIYKDEQ